jgi:pilus assembly protein CpaF
MSRAASRDALERLAESLHHDLVGALDLRRSDVARLEDHELRRVASAKLAELLRGRALPAGLDAESVGRFVLDEALGLGPLEPLLADERVAEIMVNGPDNVFVERSGVLWRVPQRFTSERALRGVIDRVVSRVGRRVDEAAPLVDARLPDGSRVHAVLPPIALCGPTLTIRKFGRRALVLRDLLDLGSISEEMITFLELCVRERRNVVVSGGTGSGKTTLLNVLSNLIPEGERIVTIEDAAELRLAHDHVVPLEARLANAEGRGAIGIRELVRNALRMRPDRIIVGECRGGEALDMLQAMNTGHDGSLTTAHANGPRDVLSRLEVMALMAGVDLPLLAIREQIASAVDIIVHQARFPCGARKVTHIVEVTGMESGVILTQDLFRFVRAGVDATGHVRGWFSGCDQLPAFAEDLEGRGVRVEPALFRRRAGAAREPA